MVNLFVFLYILFLLFGIGFIVRMFLNKLAFDKNSAFEEVSLDLYVILGFVTLTAFLAIVSIFYKIGLTIHLLVFFGVFIILLFCRERFFELISNYILWLKRNKLAWIFFLAVWPFFFLVVLYSACDVLNYDSGLYHVQFIQWIREYKALPGLAWIHERLGFNSHFHLTCAFFDLSFLELKDSSGASIIFYPVNSFFLLLLLARCVFKVYQGFTDKNIFPLTLYGVIFVLSFCTFTPSIQSPTPDSITAILIFYAFFIFTENITNHASGTWTFHHFFLVSLVMAIVTFKLSAALVILLIPVILFRGKVSLNKIVLILSLGALIIAPYLIRNVIFTGWLIYPFPQLDFFSFDWKLPAESVVTLSNVIKGWAKLSTVSYQEVLAMPLSEWVPLWWTGLSNNTRADAIRKYILVFNLFAPFLMTFLWLSGKNKSEWTKYWLTYLVLVLCMIFWFANAPEPRFVYGFTFFSAAFVLAVAVKQFQRALRGSIVLIAITCLLLWTFDVPKPHQKYLHGEFPLFPRPMEIPVVELVSNIEGTLTVKKPVAGDQCFDMTIPCAPYPNVNVKLRGKTIEEGFTYPK
jgi:hypothetical protein